MTEPSRSTAMQKLGLAQDMEKRVPPSIIGALQALPL